MVSRNFLIGTVAAILLSLASGLIGWRLRGPAYPVVEPGRVAAPSVPSPSPIDAAKRRLAHEAFCADVSVLPSIVSDLRHKNYQRVNERLGVLVNSLDDDLHLSLVAGDARTYNEQIERVELLTGKDRGAVFFQLVSALETSCHMNVNLG